MIQAMEEGFSVAERVQIEELYARHAWALDTADVDGSPSSTPRTRRSTTSRPAASRAPALRAGSPRRRATIPTSAAASTGAGTTAVVRDGARCRVSSFGLAAQLHSSGATFLPWLGYTEDVLVAPDGVWLFAQRRFLRWEGSVLAGFRGR